jgi:hypothetical protein
MLEPDELFRAAALRGTQQGVTVGKDQFGGRLKWSLSAHRAAADLCPRRFHALAGHPSGCRQHDHPFAGLAKIARP